MQPIQRLRKWLTQHAEHYLFTTNDLRSLFQDLSDNAFKTLLSRAVCSSLIERLCRGLYLYKPAMPHDGLLLFHAAARLRANAFNYISLETVLSDVGIISQIPMNWISIMSSGRSYHSVLRDFGTIEFIHTNQKPTVLAKQLIYDYERGLWRANVALALNDMKATHRNCDLINWDIVNEFI